MSTVEKLLKMKKQIEDAKNEVSKLEGQKETYLNNLKELGCNSIEEAEIKEKELKEEFNTLTIQLEKDMEELEAKHDWNL